MTESKVSTASAKAHSLDETTQHLRKSAKRKYNIALILGSIAFLILLAVGVIGVVKQNQIANKNKTHIDCIVKLLATPQKPGTSHKFISDASQTCDIKFN